MANETLTQDGECRALVPAQAGPTAGPGGRPMAAFLVQILAAAAGFAQARRRRRAEPSAIARYGAPAPVGAPRFERVL
jgi:hypothetical protein